MSTDPTTVFTTNFPSHHFNVSQFHCYVFAVILFAFFIIASIVNGAHESSRVRLVCSSKRVFRVPHSLREKALIPSVLSRLRYTYYPINKPCENVQGLRLYTVRAALDTPAQRSTRSDVVVTHHDIETDHVGSVLRRALTNHLHSHSHTTPVRCCQFTRAFHSTLSPISCAAKKEEKNEQLAIRLRN